MKINEAIEIIGAKFPIMKKGAKEALKDNNKKIDFVNMILDQYYETYEQQDRLQKLFGEDVVLCLVKWARQEALKQEYFIQQVCLKDDIILN